MRPFIYKLVKALSILPVFVLVLGFSARAQQTLTTIDGWNAYVKLPSDYSTTTSTYPVIVFIPGIGEIGTNPAALINYGPNHFVAQGHNMEFTVNGVVEKPIVISIQPTAAWPGTAVLNRKLDSIVKRWRVNTNRIYLTGLSMGGWSWDNYVAQSTTYANRVAAMVIMSAPPPDNGISNMRFLAQTGGKWWGFEGSQDLRRMTEIRDTLNYYAAGSARYTMYTGGHCCWNTWYDPAYNEAGESIYTWMLKQNKAGAANQLPTANAGADINVVLPTSTTSLVGSGADTDGTIVSYSWAKLSGPAGVVISSPAASTTGLTGLVQGTYQFELTVTDNAGAVARDQVNVTVSAQAVGNAGANAGADTLIYLNQKRPDTAFLNGSASVGATSYQWTKISGPGTQTISTPTAAFTQVLGMQEGTFAFKLTVNGTSSDTVVVTVRDFMKKNVRPCRVGQPQSFTLTKVGNEVYQPYITKNNVLPNLMGGDTLFIPGGTYTGGVEFGDVGGGPGCPIIIAPKDQPVVITSNGYFRFAVRDTGVVCYAVMDGTTLRSKGYPYGFVVDNNASAVEITAIGLTANWVHDLEIKGVNIMHAGVGIMVKMDSKAVIQGRYDKIVLRNIKIHDNLIFRINGEGMYIGHTDPTGTQVGNSSPYGPPPRMDSVEIYNNVVDSTAWDGIQLSNALNGCKIYSNLVRRYGTLNKSSQQSGIISGSNISSVQVYDNMTSNGTGGGIMVFGYNPSNVFHNIVDSVRSGANIESGIYMQRNNALPENPPALVPNVTGNIVKNAERVPVFLAYAPTTVGGNVSNNYFIENTSNTVSNNSGATVSNNTVMTGFPIAFNSITKTTIGYSVSVTQGNATQSFTDVKALVDWLFSRLNTPPAPNIAPNANAGTDISITLPLNSTTLNGSASSDPDGTITTYAWTRISGPTQVTIASAATATTAISNLVQGTYGFRLVVTDNNGVTDSDTVLVTVNAAPNVAPVANAGANITITLPVNNTTLNGSASADADGTISTYSWTRVSGPTQVTIANAATATTAISNLVQGTYGFRLVVTDNSGATSSDTVLVIVNPAVNVAPVANAGTDISITLPVNTTTLNGTASSDADGSIATYNWARIAGPTQVTIANAATASTGISNLVQGVYQFQLTVTDNSGAVDRDTVLVYVNAANNVAPNANAGTDITITLPVNNTTLNGSASSDPDGTIASYSWTRISGPAQVTFANASAATTAISNLAQGTYSFRLTVTDNSGDTDSDTVLVIVNPAPNVAPVANAGANITITLPVNSTTLNGTASSDADGTIASYSWTRISGPAQVTIANAAAATTGISNLLQGTYGFRLVVTDNRGATSSDTVLVIVNPAANVAPVANAGANITITLPVNSTTLNGTASSDADGTIASYSWTRISGPAQVTIANATAATTGISNLVQGTYGFRLVVTDNSGASSSDTVLVIVNPAANVAPVANAGTDVTITLPVNTASLNGSATDADGTIASYNWVRISGPGAATITSSNSAQASATGLSAGTHVFELTVTDNSGAVAKDQVTVTVLNAIPVNNKPVANAGTDTIIALPANKANLSGAGSYDTDGSIISYQWRQIAGPAAATILNAGVVSTEAGNLIAGLYSFELTVTDNMGLKSSDTVTVDVMNTMNSTQKELTVYPNPASTFIKVNMFTEINGQSKITIYSITGQVVKVQQFAKGQNAQEVTVDVTRLNKGTYYLEVLISSKKRITAKFIKQ